MNRGNSDWTFSTRSFVGEAVSPDSGDTIRRPEDSLRCTGRFPLAGLGAVFVAKFAPEALLRGRPGLSSDRQSASGHASCKRFGVPRLNNQSVAEKLGVGLHIFGDPI